MSFVPPILEVEDLHVTFKVHGGDVHALRGAWLKIAPGEIVGLVGESGSGKSVLGLTALGLLPAHPRPLVSGSVFLAEEDMVKASEDTPPQAPRQRPRRDLPGPDDVAEPDDARRPPGRRGGRRRRPTTASTSCSRTPASPSPR